jgi:V8-like Glu-specific endopeptidase
MFAWKAHPGQLLRVLVLTLFVMPLTAIAEDDDDDNTPREAPVVPDTPEKWVIRSTVMVRSEQAGEPAGWGSGFFINNSGLMLTNNHVIDPMHGRSQEERARISRAFTKWDYKIIIDSGTTAEKILEADVLHQTESGDMALLQLRKVNGKYPETPYFLTLAPLGVIQNRMFARIVGFPGGERRTRRVSVTTGKVTDLMRSRNGVVNYIETDAEVHGGNSGGSVTSRSGEVIGIATHKRFEEGQKDRSGAVPSKLIRQFIMTAFLDERVPKDIDILPFANFFLDQDGILELPRYKRDSQDIRIHFGKNRLRNAELITKRINLVTTIGEFEIPLDHAAYLFSNGKIGDLFMDGGDRLQFSTKEVKIEINLDGEQREIPLDKIDVLCFPRKLDLVPALSGDGVILDGDGTRLSLSKLAGQVRVNNARFDLEQIESISPLAKDMQAITTVDDQRLEGRFSSDSVVGSTTWAPDGIEFHLSKLRKARFRPIEWTYFYARGRLLTDRLETEHETLSEALELLDTSEYTKAKPILEKLKVEQEKDRFSSREDRSKRQLAEGVLMIRTGEFNKARKLLSGLKSDHYVGGVAEAYCRVLDEYPDGTYSGMPISQPDVLWRASTAVALHEMSSMREKMSDLPGLGELRRDELTLESKEMRQLFRQLDEIEAELDVIDRLEIGIAQGRIVYILELAVWSRVALMRELTREYNELRSEFRGSGSRTEQIHLRGKMRRIEKMCEKTYREFEKLLKRLREDSVGFSLDAPDFEKEDDID